MRQTTNRRIMVALLASTMTTAALADEDDPAFAAPPPARAEAPPPSEPVDAAAPQSKNSSSSERQRPRTAAQGETEQGQVQARSESGRPARTTGAPRSGASTRRQTARDTQPALLANCQELQNTSGVRMLIHVPTSRNVRLGIFDRSSNRELDRDVLASSGKTAIGYARIQWGTRMMSAETLIKGAFLISAYERDRYYQGTILADNGDGGLFVRTAHLGPGDEGTGRRWTLRLGGDRTLSCRMERDAAGEPREATADREPRKRPRREQ